MDLSALIFVALALAWAVYLVPRAIRHHDEAARSRSVERFSHTMRVLSRRDAVTPTQVSGDGRVVLSPGRPASTSVVVTKASVHEVSVETSSPAASAPLADPRPPAVRRAAAARAAQRRRRVLSGILAVVVLTVLAAATTPLGWPWVGIPVAVLVAWLVTCRLARRIETGEAATAQLARAQRRDERAARADERRERRIARREEREEDFFGGYEPIGDLPPEDDGDHTDQIAAVVTGAGESVRSVVESGVWDPVPVTLPTYVDKVAAAPRSVRTIDLDSTGVWTSGPSESDSALAREAEQDARESRDAERARADQERRATGS